MSVSEELQDRTTQYALDVVSGAIKNVGNRVLQACERHLEDLEKSKLAPYRYYFDVEEANNIIDYAENLVLAEAEEYETVICYPFQCFILGSLNGWRVKDKGYRRFRTSYVQLGRQNGKSFINGILASYFGNFTSRTFGKIFLTATKQDQAAIIFTEIKKFIESDADLGELFKIKEHNYTIECLTTGTIIKAVSGDTKSMDGFAVYLGIVDEYHAHKTNQMYKLLEGGIKKQKSALISVITTAGFNMTSPCYRLYEQCCQILDGVYANDSQFIYIAELNEGDDPFYPQNWIKANPILEFDEDALENLKPIAITAQQMGGEDLRDFMVKQLNTWIQFATDTYIQNIQWWKQSASKRTLKDFVGKRCYIGVDLSSGGDLTSIVYLFPYWENDEKKYFVYHHSYMPKNAVVEHMNTDSVPYDMWIKKGLITVTETLGGIKTDYKYILSEIQKNVDEYNLDVAIICYDPHNASAFVGDLEQMGYDTMSVTQTAKVLNDATVDLRLTMKQGAVEHNEDDELMQWAISNAKTIKNSYGEIKIDKETSTDRIDPLDALIDAWTEAMREEQEFDINDSLDKWFEQFG